MDNENLKKEIESLKQEINNLKENIKSFGHNSRFKKFIATAFRNVNIAIGIAITTIISSLILYAATAEKPFDFKEGKIISADEVNANFDALYSSVEELYNDITDIKGITSGLQKSIKELAGRSGTTVSSQKNISDNKYDDYPENTGWYSAGDDLIYDKGRVRIKKQLIVPGIKGSSNGCSLVLNGYRGICNDSDPIVIPDNNGTIQDTIEVPEMGKIEDMTVSVNLTSSDISGIMIMLIDPEDNDYLLYDGGSSGGVIDTSSPDETRMVSGSLSSWRGREPQGQWSLEVTNTGGRNRGDDADGALLQWCVNFRTADSRGISVRNGDFSVDGYVGIGTNNPQRRLHVNDVLRLEPTPDEPENPSAGDMYFDSEINKLRVYDGNSWQECW